MTLESLKVLNILEKEAKDATRSYCFDRSGPGNETFVIGLIFSNMEVHIAVFAKSAYMLLDHNLLVLHFTNEILHKLLCTIQISFKCYKYEYKTVNG